MGSYIYSRLSARHKTTRSAAGSQPVTSWLTSSLPRSPYLKYGSVGRCGRARDLPRLRPPRFRLVTLCRTLAVGLALVVLAFTGTAQAKAPKFYFDVRGVKVPPGTLPGLQAKTRDIFLAELKRQPVVVTDLGTPSPRGAELEKALQAKKLQGFGVVLRVVKAKHTLSPPAAGKVYKMLMVEVEVAIDAEKIPSGQMALAGEGSAQVGTEVQKVKPEEQAQLTSEALTEAVRQAVTRSISKLSTGEKPAATRKKSPPRKRK